MVRSVSPYLRKGGAFVAVGYLHLDGILRGLKAHGYKVKKIEFSTPLKIPSPPPVYSKELIKTWGEPQYYEREADIYSNPKESEIKREDNLENYQFKDLRK